MHATPEHTQVFASLSGARPEFYRSWNGLTVSSVGLGTYLGEPDGATDQKYAAAAVRAVELGVNVLDTAANYRFQRSERALGAALQQLQTKGIERSALVLCTKGGYLAFDGAVPADPKQWFEETFVQPEIAGYVDLIQGVHCMAPKYLKHQVGQSLRNLGIDCIDIYYVHNPETQLGLLTRAAFYKRLREAFAALEEEVAAGRITRYGVATWNGFRVPPEDGRYLELKLVLQAAREAAGGAEHHFGFVQLPYNLAMTEGFTLANQDDRPFFEAAAEQGIAVVTSAALMQAQVLGRIPQEIKQVAGAQTDAQTALQFARRAPGVLTALTGMRELEHVEENLGVRGLAPVARYTQFFS